MASLLDQQSEVGAHNRMGLSCIIPDKDLSSSNRYTMYPGKLGGTKGVSW